jgi:hypothetical protein
MQTMQRFLKENYQKKLSLKFIRINNVRHLFRNSFPVKRFDGERIFEF